MPATRPRADIELDAAIGIIAPNVVGIKWLDYGENLQQAKREPKKIILHRDMYNALADKAGGKLAFKKVFLKSVFTSIVKTGTIQSWFKQDSHIEDWIETMTKRMMVQCRHIMQAAGHPRAKWLVGFRVGEAAVEDLGGALEEAPAGDEHKYYVGWCTETFGAWRSLVDDPTATKEFASKNYVVAADPLAPLIAKWNDGFAHPISDMTCGKYSEMQNTKFPGSVPSGALPAAGSAAVSTAPEPKAAAVKKSMKKKSKKVHTDALYEGWDKDDQRITVRPRKDRQELPLISIYCKDKQILQVASKLFPDIKVASAFMVSIAMAYCAGTYTKIELAGQRDERLKVSNPNKLPGKLNGWL
jgi:hypothetical protein